MKGRPFTDPSQEILNSGIRVPLKPSDRDKINEYAHAADITPTLLTRNIILAGLARIEKRLKYKKEPE
jgi:hypothetical protein